MSRDVAVIVPWRPGGCPYRETAWEWCRNQYEYPVVVAEHGPGPWVKARAVMPAIEGSTAEIIVVADADVFCEGLELAIDKVREGHRWAIPHRRVRRLTEQSTERLYAGELPHRLRVEEPAYVGALTGGLLVIERDLALDVPMDVRFEGWGGEDRAWGWALLALVGGPWRGNTQLFHLWHPPQPRTDRNHGSAETEALRQRYVASRDPVRMRGIVDEAKEALYGSPRSRRTRRPTGTASD